MLSHLTPTLISAVLLLACTTPPQTGSTPSSRPETVTPSPTIRQEALPETVRNQVKTALADELGIAPERLQIGRYSRETWPDGCLGLGGPAELCTEALVDGWQVEVIDPETDQHYVYRTDLRGNQVRRADQGHILPSSVRDRLFEHAEAEGLQPSRSLGVIDAEPRTWGGCYGLATANQACTRIAILGWRAIISDGNQYWIYHTDNSGDTLRLNETASGGTAIPSFISPVNPRSLGDETRFQSTFVHSSGRRETFLLEADGRLIHIQEQDGDGRDLNTTTVSQAQMQAFVRQLEQLNFAHFDGIRYGSPQDSDAPQVILTSRTATVAYTADSVNDLPAPLQAILQAWEDLSTSAH